MQRRVAEILLAPDSLLAESLDEAALRKLLASHRSGAVDATDRIWRLLNLQIWGETFLKGRGRMDWAELTVPKTAVG